jgi:hypothetical protein
LGCSREVEGCAKGFHLRLVDINLLWHYRLTGTHSCLHARVHVSEPFRSSSLVNGWPCHPAPFSSIPAGDGTTLIPFIPLRKQFHQYILWFQERVSRLSCDHW